MDFEDPQSNVNGIRRKLEALRGSHVKLRANMGRSRIVERDGVILNTHDSLFIVEVEERRGRHARQSFQYVDVLTGTVELEDCSTGEPIFEPVVE